LFENELPEDRTPTSTLASSTLDQPFEASPAVQNPPPQPKKKKRMAKLNQQCDGTVQVERHILSN